SAMDLHSDGPCSVIANFDTYFSLIRHFNNIDSIPRDEAWQTLLRALKQHTNNISPMVEPGADVDNQTRKQHLTALKMICYLVVQLSNLYEAEATKPTTHVTTSKGRGRSHAASKRKTPSSAFDWDIERDAVIELIGHMVQLDINRLWNPPLVEEEFVNLITGFCYKLLENPTVTKTKTTKDLVFNLLATAIKKYNTGLGTTLKIIQMIQHFEHLVPHLSQAVELMATEFGVKSLVAEIIREIGMMNPSDLSKDSSGTRAFADFIVDLTSRIPSIVLTNISMLMCHLDGESYSMRNGVLGAMGEIVQRVLSTGELDDNAKNLRDQFLDKLELPLDHLKEKLADETTKLKEMAPNLTQQSTDQVPVVACAKDTWDAMLPELQAAAEEYMYFVEEQTEDDDASVLYVFNNDNNKYRSFKEIRELLNQGHHKKALIALTNAHKLWPDETLLNPPAKLWPDETLLNPPAKDQENLFEEKEGETDTLSKEDKEDVITNFLCVLKAIFIGKITSKNNLHLCNPCIPGSEDQPMQDDEELNPEALLEVANQSTKNADQDNNDMVNDIIKQQLVVQYLKDYVNFQTKMETAVPVICQLLGSKTTSDVSESIEFFVTSYEFGLRNAIIGVRRMLVLIWSRDNAVKESVVEAYKGLYLDPPAPNQRAKTGIIVKNLITLTYGASIGDLTSLEELMGELMKAKLIPGSLIKLLWEKFTMKVAQTTPEESRAALILLRMLASAETDIIRSNVDVLVNTGLGTRAEEDFLLARDTCVALLKIIKSKKPGNAEEEPFRFSYSHEIFERLTHLIVTGISKVDDIHFAPMAEQAINVIYTLSEHPEMVCENIIRKLVTCLIVRKDTQTPEPNDSQDAQTQADDVMSQDNIPKLMSCHSSILARFLVLCGHVALRQLIHLDVSIFKEIKRRQAVQESENEEKRRDKEMGRKNRNDVNATANTTKVYILANLEMIMMGIKVMLMIVVMLMVVVMLMIVVVMLMIVVVILMMIEVMIVVVMVMMVEVMLMIVVVMVEVMMVVVMVMMVVVMLMIVVVMVMMVVVMMMVVLMLMMIAMMMDTTTNETAEEDMGLTGATADDVESEYIRKICEQEIVTGQNLLALLRPLLVCICSNPSRFSDPGLQAAVTLALAKFMLVSSEFCESHLQLLFTVLEKSPHATIRANTIIALGDLTFRFPNLLEPWTSHLYARLRDESAQVRKNTMMVLTHLILNDMVKVKGNISEMATCLEDKDQRITDLAKLFFLELAKKGNAVYNILPDIISRLSDPDCGIEEEPFRNILKYLLSFIQKDRQSESLVEKLCHRFRATSSGGRFSSDGGGGGGGGSSSGGSEVVEEEVVMEEVVEEAVVMEEVAEEAVVMEEVVEEDSVVMEKVVVEVVVEEAVVMEEVVEEEVVMEEAEVVVEEAVVMEEVVEEEVVMEDVVEEDSVMMEEVAEEVVEEEEEAVVMEEVVEEVVEKDSVVMEVVVEEVVVEEAVVMEEVVEEEVVMWEVVEEDSVVMEEVVVEVVVEEAIVMEEVVEEVVEKDSVVVVEEVVVEEAIMMEEVVEEEVVMEDVVEEDSVGGGGGGSSSGGSEVVEEEVVMEEVVEEAVVMEEVAEEAVVMEEVVEEDSVVMEKVVVEVVVEEAVVMEEVVEEEVVMEEAEVVVEEAVVMEEVVEEEVVMEDVVEEDSVMMEEVAEEVVEEEEAVVMEEVVEEVVEKDSVVMEVVVEEVVVEEAVVMEEVVEEEVVMWEVVEEDSVVMEEVVVEVVVEEAIVMEEVVEEVVEKDSVVVVEEVVVEEAIVMEEVVEEEVVMEDVVEEDSVVMVVVEEVVVMEEVVKEEVVMEEVVEEDSVMMEEVAEEVVEEEEAVVME
ncbi:hypothetical protein QZH41_008305, partial [Actinostola sp. cb2023]